MATLTSFLMSQCLSSLSFMETVSFATYCAGICIVSAIMTYMATNCGLEQTWPQSSFVPDNSNFDFIIVGAGSAGCVLANRLTEIANWRVLLVEAGDDPPIASTIPALFNTLHKSDCDWEYYTVDDDFAMQGYEGGVPWPRGKCLGGSSSINAMYYVRGNPSDYDKWYAAGNDGWNYAEVLKYFIKSETINDETIINDPEAIKYHGRKGPLKVDRFNYTQKQLSDSLLAAWNESGLEIINDFNARTQMGVSNCRGTIDRNERCSTAKGYLLPAVRRENLKLLKNTMVSRVILDYNQRKAVGIEVIRQNRRVARFYATNEVILSAGTINTPQLLMLSGIGPKEHLHRFGISVIADLPVGKNLKDHPQIIFPFVAGTTPYEVSSFIQTSCEYCALKDGLLASHGSPDAMAFFSTVGDKNVPDMQVSTFIFPKNYFLYSYLCRFYVGFTSDLCDQFEALNRVSDMITFCVILPHPVSTGEILLRNPNPKEYPIITANYFSVPQDLETMVKGLKTVSGLVNMSFFRYMNASIPIIPFGNCQFRDSFDSYLECYTLHAGTTYYHPVGTAKMGPISDKSSVVSDRLKVHTIDSLRVIDASIMPDIPRGNTNGPTVMIAEMGADFIKKFYGVF